VRAKTRARSQFLKVRIPELPHAQGSYFCG
jgi:hypothetical protein